jgi:capsular polysaccharide biosynthesis protein
VAKYRIFVNTGFIKHNLLKDIIRWREVGSLYKLKILTKESIMEFELGDIAKLFRRRLLFISALTLFSVMAIGYYSFYVIKPEYEASATLLVQSDNGGEKSQVNDIVANQKLVITYGEIIKSNRIAAEVINRLHLKLPVEQLLSQIKIRTNGESLLTTLIVTDHDPKQAVTIANTFANAFNDNLGTIMHVNNVLILDEAKGSDHPKPVNPKPFLNIAVAFVLSVLSSIGISVWLELSHKTVKNSKDIRHDLQLPVLGVVGKLKPSKRILKKIQKMNREGASEGVQESVQIVLSRGSEIL